MMSEAFSLEDAARMALAALDGGSEAVLGVVVAAPSNPSLIGRRLAWDGERMHGNLDEPALTAAAARVLSTAPAFPGCRSIPGTGIELYSERVEPPPELVIVGAGHIAQPLARLGRLLDFRVTVLDDRPDFARRERFPDAHRVVVVDFDDPFAGIPITPRSHVVLVTRGHRYDYDCARALARMGVEPAYLGMIGSRRRVRAAFEQLAREGFSAEWLSRVHAPLGLDIGAETPAEIAVAIAAEIILAVRGGTGAPLRDRASVVRYLRGLRVVTASAERP
ncbi:XdhC/CoxI family protein [soil metagenome]